MKQPTSMASCFAPSCNVESDDVQLKTLAQSIPQQPVQGVPCSKGGFQIEWSTIEMFQPTWKWINQPWWYLEMCRCEKKLIASNFHCPMDRMNDELIQLHLKLAPFFTTIFWGLTRVAHPPKTSIVSHHQILHLYTILQAYLSSLGPFQEILN